MQQKYTLSGSPFYSELEALCFSGRPVEVVFLNNESKAVIHGKITELADDGLTAYLIMDSGLRIPLDNLLKVNGAIPPTFC